MLDSLEQKKPNVASQKPTLLGIFAHPDDESFGPGGTLAKYAKQGVDVHICIVTDGAAGSYEAQHLNGYSSLAARRAEELRGAVGVLQATLHTLGYRDSGMEGSPENRHPESLYQADLDQVARDMVRLIRTVRPHVIVTHDPTGGYFHPDHIRVNHAVSRAFPKAGDPDAYPDLLAEGCKPWQPQRLYYSVIPQSSLRWMILLTRLFRRDPRRFGRNGDIDLTQLGVPEDQVHVRVPIRDYMAIKDAASAHHVSQGGGRFFKGIPTFLRVRLFGHELFSQAYPPQATPHTDFFAGVELSELA